LNRLAAELHVVGGEAGGVLAGALVPQQFLDGRGNLRRMLPQSS